MASNSGFTAKPRVFTLILLALQAIVTIPLAIAEPEADRTSLPVNLEFSIRNVELSPSVHLHGIQVQCENWEIYSAKLTCKHSTVTVKRSPVGSLSFAADIEWEPTKNRWSVVARGLIADKSRMSLKYSQLNEVVDVKLELLDFPIAHPQKYYPGIDDFLNEHAINSGTLDVAIACRLHGRGQSNCSASGQVQEFNLDGVNVAEDVAAGFDAKYSSTSLTETIEFGLSLRDGAVYIEPGFTLGTVNPGFFLSPDATPIELAGRIERRATGEIRIHEASLRHKQVVDMDFSGDLGFSPSPQWKALNFNLKVDDVNQFYTTYMQPIALDTAFNALETAGALQLGIIGADNEIDEFNLRFKQVYIDDDARRFSLYGLDGDVIVHAGEELRPSRIRWLSGAVYEIQIGEGRIDWLSANRSLKVDSWHNVAIFDGEFRMDSLEIDQFGVDRTQVALSGTLTPITLSALTAAFGSIPLSGKLSGTIPRLTYSENRLKMDGDLRINVFDGRVVLRDLEIDKMFSTVPVLSANLSVESLDLEKLTSTFSFGNISGHLDGKIDDLVLQAWHPTQFDASFATPLDDDDPHRISQQAVDNLGRLGAGTGTGLSQGWLGLIPSYSYGRLGIGCRLEQGHCAMRGVEEANDGSFFILTRGGILPPWISVKGSGRRIKWQTLVDGIKQISQGEFELDVGVAR
ncbi:MAG: hypothetical protein ACI915_000690 [Gammaproteobacteria bacterium]